MTGKSFVPHAQKPTPEQIEEIKRLHAEGWQVKPMSRKLGITRHYINKVLSPDVYQRKLARELALRRREGVPAQRVVNRFTPPDHVLEERDRAYSVPQGFFGEPPKGRSALERRG